MQFFVPPSFSNKSLLFVCLFVCEGNVVLALRTETVNSVCEGNVVLALRTETVSVFMKAT